MFKNLRVAAKLGIGFGAVLVMLACIAAIGLSRMASIQANFELAENENALKIKLANGLMAQQNLVARAVRNIALLDDPQEMKKEEARILESRAKYGELMDKLTTLIKSEEGKKIMAQLGDDVKVLRPLVDKAIALGLAGKGSEATNVIIKEVRGPQAALFKDINALIERQEKVNADLMKESSQEYQSAVTLMLAISGGAALIGLLLAWLVTRSITRPLTEAVAAANAIAAGDLSTVIVVDSSEETGLLKAAMKSMQDNLVKIVGEIRDIVAAANRGDFSTKMDLAGKAGYTKELSELLNQLSDTVDTAFKDVVRVASALAHGDLSQKVTRDYQGDFDQAKQAVNTTVDALTGIVGEIRDIVAAANRGDFSTKMDLAGKAGYTKELSELLNQLSNTVDAAIKDIGDLAQGLEQGDLTRSISRDYMGSFDLLKQALNNTVAKLAQTIGDVNATAEALGAATQQVSSTAQSLSQASSEQAASVE
ncbi:MAG TPA: MCP four helix bundle domain-containing protein, partial [Rhodocyclaceae bacterium]